MMLQVIPIISIPGFGDRAAEKVCTDMKIQSQNDRDKLDEAKKQVYLKGFTEGVLTVGPHTGKKVCCVSHECFVLIVQQFAMDPAQTRCGVMSVSERQMSGLNGHLSSLINPGCRAAKVRVYSQAPEASVIVQVSDVKGVIRQEMMAAGQAMPYSEPEKQVMSRSGDVCVVALTDQWYLNYGEDEWREATRCLFRRERKNDSPGIKHCLC